MKNKTTTPHSQLLGKLKQLGFDVQYGIQFKSGVYTFAHATATKEEFDAAKVRTLEGEGVSRRSYQDKPDDIMGKVIAEGRAIKAVWLKAIGIKDLHRHHLLMG